MRSRSPLVAVAVLVVAGCVAPASREDLAASSSDDPSDLPSTVPDSGDAAPDDWWLATLDVPASGAAVVGFEWTVPAYAVVPSAFFGDEHEYDTVVLEFAPHVEEGAVVPIEWGLVSFVEDGTELRVQSVYIDAPAVFAGGLGPSTRSEAVDAEFEPGFLWLGFDDLEAGDVVRFALVARALEPTTVSVAFRALAEDPGWDERPAKSTDAFLRARGDVAPRAVDVAGSASEWQHAAYFDASFLPWHYEVVQGPVEVTRTGTDARPVGQMGTIATATSFAADSGWTLFLAARWSELGTATWSAVGDVHGEPIDAGGREVALLVPVASYVLGFPYAIAIAEGEGGSTARFEVDGASAGRTFQAHVALDLGATLDVLFGSESEEFVYAGDGLVDGAGYELFGDGTRGILAGRGLPTIQGPRVPSPPAP